MEGKISPLWSEYVIDGSVPLLPPGQMLQECLAADADAPDKPEGPYTSFRHMFGWNVFGILLFGPAVATHRFFDTLNKIEIELNKFLQHNTKETDFAGHN